MLFYTVLIVAVLIVAIVIPLIYCIFISAGSVVYRTVLPSTFDSARGKLKTDPKHTPGLSTVISQGMMTNETRGILAWSGAVQSKTTDKNIANKAQYVPAKVFPAAAQTTTRIQGRMPIREYRSTQAGKVYKVTRRPGNQSL